MKKFAKLLAMVLAVSMVLTMFVGAFDDTAAIKDETKLAAIETVYEAGIMMGNEKGEFMPEKSLTRQEMAKIMFALYNYEQEAADIYALYASLSFADYAAIPAWSQAYIGYAAAAEIIVGNADGEANAKGTLSYVEAAIMLLRSLDLEGSYDDGGEEEVPAYTGSKWYQNAVLAASYCGLFDGLDIANYKAAATRADVAVMIANAIELDGGDTYYLAEKVNAVVVGTTTVEEDEEDVEYFVVAGGENFKTAGYDVEAVVGHEVEAIVEAIYGYEYDEAEDDYVWTVVGYETLDLTVIDPVYEGSFVSEDMAIVNAEDEDGNVYQNFTIDGEVIVEDYVASDYTVYTAYNTNEYTLGDMGAVEYDTVDIIINENTIFWKVDAVSFEKLSADWDELVLEQYDSEKKQWTGEFYWGSIKVNEAYAALEIEAGTWINYTVVDGELADLAVINGIEIADLDVAYTVADGYSVSYNGVELYMDGFDADAIWEDVILGEEYLAYIYNGYVLIDYVEVVEEEEEEEDTIIYAILGDYSAELEVVVDEEEETTTYVWTVTVEAIVDNAATTFSFEVEQEAPALDLSADAYDWLDYDFAKFTVNADGEIEAVAEVTLNAAMITELGEDGIFAGEVEFEDVLFIDCSESDIALEDITVETEGEKTTTTVAGKKVSALTVIVVYVEDYAIVIYDPACEYGVYGELLA